ncbi:MAG: hypothetical protein KY433_11135 [Actinobacteria bacterium]|nr:hypothetical protein [Actinomycetota bacterium]
MAAVGQSSRQADGTYEGPAHSDYTGRLQQFDRLVLYAPSLAWLRDRPWAPLLAFALPWVFLMWTFLRGGLASHAALCWPALINGQPFFHPDTQAYVHGPGEAVAKLFGRQNGDDWSWKGDAGPASPGVGAVAMALA